MKGPAYSAAYYQANKELIRAKLLKKRKTDPEALKKHNALGRNWKKNNKVQSGQISEAWRQRNLEHKLNLYMIRYYGITLMEYKQIAEDQGGVCAVCKKPETAKYRATNPSYEKRLCVDHSHVTGEVRGLLCRRCNAAIGMFDENMDYLLAAVDYLAEHYS